MINFQNETNLNESQIESIKQQYIAWINGYIAPEYIDVVIIRTKNVHGKQYAELITHTTEGGEYKDRFEL